MPLDDEATFRLIRTTHTLGCFQIESPGQRELIGKFGPERFEDLVIDISLFRPGPVKSDMIVPFLNARQGWADADYLHPTLVKALAETEGVVVFHEQILLIVAETTGVTLAEADEVRRALGSVKGQAEVEAWWRPAALARGYSRADVDRIWAVLAAFASFGFCKAHAAAFALPTYQSAWLKTHHPAAFFAGVLTHDPGMYPKRLILDDARSFGIEILGLDVNASKPWYAVERVDVAPRPDCRPELRLQPPTCRMRGGTASASRSPTSRGSPRPRSPGPSPGRRTRPWPTSGAAPTSAGRSSSGWSSPGGSTRCTGSGSAARPGRATRSPGATCSCTSPSWTAGLGRAAGPFGAATRRSGPGDRRRCRPPDRAE